MNFYTLISGSVLTGLLLSAPAEPSEQRISEAHDGSIPSQAMAGSAPSASETMQRLLTSIAALEQNADVVRFERAALDARLRDARSQLQEAQALLKEADKRSAQAKSALWELENARADSQTVAGREPPIATRPAKGEARRRVDETEMAANEAQDAVISLSLKVADLRQLVRNAADEASTINQHILVRTAISEAMLEDLNAEAGELADRPNVSEQQADRSTPPKKAAADSYPTLAATPEDGDTGSEPEVAFEEPPSPLSALDNEIAKRRQTLEQLGAEERRLRASARNARAEQAKLERWQAESGALEEELSEKRKRLADLGTREAEHTLRLASAAGRLLQWERVGEVHQAALSNRQADLAALDAALAERREAVDALKQQETDLRRRLGDLESSARANQAETEASEKRIAEREAALAAVEERLAAGTAEYEALRLRKDAILEEVAQSEEALRALRSDLDTGKAEHTTLQRRVKRLKEDAGSISAQTTSAAQELAGLRRELADRQAGLELTRDDLAEAADELNALSEEQAAVEAGLSSTRARAEDARRQRDANAARAYALAVEAALATEQLRKRRADAAEAAPAQEMASLPPASADTAPLQVVAEDEAPDDPQPADLARLEAELEALRASEATHEKAVEALRAEISSLRAALELARNATPPPQSDQPNEAVAAAAVREQASSLASLPPAAAEPSASGAAAGETEQVERSAAETNEAAIRAALRSAPGLPSMRTPETQAFARLLLQGNCVTDAMTEAYGTINRQSLLYLLRSLDTC